MGQHEYANWIEHFAAVVEDDTGLRVGQVVALRGPDGEWEYDRIIEFVDDGTARLAISDGRRKLETLRQLTLEER